MRKTKPRSGRPSEDAEAIEDKYGSLAEVYAETRTEAAEMAGNHAGKEHWKDVAATLDEDDDR